MFATFIASMGSNVHTGLHATTSARGEDETQTNEGGIGDIGVWGDEEEFAMVDMPVKVNTSEVR